MRSRSSSSRSTWRARGATSASTASSSWRSAQYDNGSGSQFNMTALAMRTAAHINGVSALHGEVTRSMWRPIWPDTPADQLPVRSITNGVHVPTWMAARSVDAARTATSGPAGATASTTRHSGSACSTFPDDELWADAPGSCAATSSRSSASGCATRWTTEQVSPTRIVAAGTLLDPTALTHRLRAAVHRLQAARADLPRSRSAGAHPQRSSTGPCRSCSPARRIRPTSRQAPPAAGLQRALDPTFGGRIAFVDDYDLHVAHYLVQGCDVWLNNPRKPLEASGTSGMKASLNGVPHLSIGDGWWAEGLQRPQRLADREPRQPRRSGRAGRGRRRGALPPARRRRSCRPSTTATPRRAAALAADRAARRSARSCRASRPGAW